MKFDILQFRISSNIFYFKLNGFKLAMTLLPGPSPIPPGNELKLFIGHHFATS